MGQPVAFRVPHRSPDRLMVITSIGTTTFDGASEGVFKDGVAG